MPKIRKWTEEDLINAVPVSRSYREVITRLGLVPAGGNYVQVARYIKMLELDISHFHGSRWNSGKKYHTKTRIILEEVLVTGSPIQSYKLKLRLFEAGLRKPECEICGWAEQAVDGRIPVELDHINGNRLDNNLNHETL